MLSLKKKKIHIDTIQQLFFFAAYRKYRVNNESNIINQAWLSITAHLNASQSQNSIFSIHPLRVVFLRWRKSGWSFGTHFNRDVWPKLRY